MILILIKYAKNDTLCITEAMRRYKLEFKVQSLKGYQDTRHQGQSLVDQGNRCFVKE